ncbi:hypothetical protein OPV22_019294 [Ensete ventricosum]|uniref:Uncharacterized protein n=1 Tax=Ensete ventricosum TaxID=4639 RepID=A0AAV8QKN0_ENSVE|nr:hypothetical protein OPV22_019294 [Ensete ventricosum]
MNKKSRLKNELKSKKSKKKRSRDSDDSSKQKARNAEQEEMKRLEGFLFGNLYTPIEFGKETYRDGISQEQVAKDAPLFFMDRTTGNEMAVYENDLCAMGKEDLSEERKPVWVDEEEERTEEQNGRMLTGSMLPVAFLRMSPMLKVVSPLLVDAEGDDILRGNDELVIKGATKLLPGSLEYSRLVDANTEEPSNGPINSVQFHRNDQLLLTTGLDRRLRFLQVDGKCNPKIQSIFIEDCLVHKASFLPDGTEVIIAGRRKFFYSFDLVKASVSKIGPLTGREEKSLEVFEVSPDSSTIAFIGNEGYILLVSSRTKELIGTLKMNGSVRSLAFADGGQQLLSSGGSSSGIVNVYKREEFLGGKGKPLKTIENLTTMVDHIKFNPDAQILAISSRMKKNGLKLVHIPSFNVFSNYPPPRFSLQYPGCLSGGFMTVGNAGGKVLLNKLHHYQNS